MSFEVVQGDEVLIVYGRLSFPERIKAYGLAPAGSMPCEGVATRLGASFVWGTPTGIQKLMKSNPSPCPRVQDEVAAARQAGLSVEARAWLDGWGRRHAAADALFGATTGVPVGLPQHRRVFPEGADAFGACVELQRSVPEVNANLRQAAWICRSWHRLVADWAKLSRLYTAGALEQLDAELDTRLQLLQIANSPAVRAAR